MHHERSPMTFVFPGERGTPFNGWSKAKSELDTASSVSGWWLHDLRRTLATGLQRLGFRLEVTEAVLNHISGSRGGIAGVYQRHDWAIEKRSALDAWSAHLPVASAHLPHRRRWRLGRPATSPPGSRRASAFAGAARCAALGRLAATGFSGF
jgi:hypothetical protein